MSKAAWTRCAAYRVIGGAAAVLLLRASPAGAKTKPLVIGEYRLSPAEAATVRAELKPPHGFEPSDECRQHAAGQTIVCFRKPRSVAISQAVTATLIRESGATVYQWEQIPPLELTCGVARLMRLRRRRDPTELRLVPMDCEAGATLGQTRLLFSADSLVLADAKSVVGSTRGIRLQRGGTLLEVEEFGRLSRCPCRANEE
jgi:hypothetical protein